MTCPTCGSANLRLSAQRTWGDALQRLRGRRAVRCRKCRLRFFASTGVVIAEDALTTHPKHTRKHPVRPEIRARRLRKRLIEVAIFGVLLVIFVLFLRYLMQEPAGFQESGRTHATAASG